MPAGPPACCRMRLQPKKYISKQRSVEEIASCLGRERPHMASSTITASCAPKPSLLEHLSLVAAGLRLRGSSPPAAAPVLFAATDAVRCRGTLRLLGPGTELLPKHPQLHLAGKSANSPATAAEMDTVVASTPRGRQPAQVAKSGTSCPLT